MNPITEPTFIERAQRAYRERGVGGVAVSALRVARRTAGRARRRWRQRRRPPLTLVVTAPAADAGRLDWSGLTAGGNESAARRLSECIVVTYGDQAPHFVPLPRAVMARHVHVPADDNIAANTGVALAETESVVFGTPARLFPEAPVLTALTAVLNRGADAVVLGSGLPAEAGELSSRFASAGRNDTAFKRGALIRAGMFAPERGATAVGDALTRLWQTGHRVGAVQTGPGVRSMWGVRGPVPADPALPTRVVYVVNGTDVRGGIRIVFEHCNRLRDRGLETMVVTFDTPHQSWFPDLRAPLIHVRDLPPSDVAVATFWTTAPFVAQLNCSRWYFIQHDEALFDPDPAYGQQVRETYRLPLSFVTISGWLVDLVKERSGKEALYIPNGINTDQFYPEPAYPRGDRVRVLVEGNKEIFWKGLSEAAEVLDGSGCEVWTLGKTGLVADREFEYPPQDELRRIYSSCDILLKTSWYEGMPLPHMEAMACGCTLLTTDVPGVRDYCVNEVNCLTAPVRDVPAIRAALDRLVADPDLRKRLAEAGLKTAAENFGWDPHIDRLARAYTDAARTARQQFASAGGL